MQADSYWDVSLLDTPHQRCIDRRENGRYLTRNFKMRDPDFISTDKMRDPDFSRIDNHNMDFLSAAIKITDKKQMKLKVTI